MRINPTAFILIFLGVVFVVLAIRRWRYLRKQRLAGNGEKRVRLYGDPKPNK